MKVEFNISTNKIFSHLTCHRWPQGQAGAGQAKGRLLSLFLGRTQRTTVKSNWKVVPKDSCEIYRERKRRQIVNERRNRKHNGFDKRCEDVVDEESNKVDQRRETKKNRKRINKKGNRKNQKHSKRKHRQRCSSPISSYHSTSITSCSSYSDMDLD
ncbi:uncharacterized protein LOC115454206 [Manduca sexta]|uniref:Uncharacterized protein n=1 Tax=Manduca sexta TaxID=7130 RepID=A0A922A112_MANSE|nr:uncharacterized protein LOC115454206 [Manduca sexta]KAG6465835.1 hypothetical protein O3G_MSEX015426 [Manduca sexta]